MRNKKRRKFVRRKKFDVKYLILAYIKGPCGGAAGGSAGCRRGFGPALQSWVLPCGFITT